MDPRIKEAFDKVRDDITQLSKEFYALNAEINSLRISTDDKIAFSIAHIKELFSEKLDHTEKSISESIDRAIKEMKNVSQEAKTAPLPPVAVVPTHNPTDNLQNATFQPQTPTHMPSLEALKGQNMAISSGNRGVPTDRPTDRPTDNPSLVLPSSYSLNSQTSKANDFDEALRVLDTLDGIKKEIRRKFKQLTPMEFQVFSLLYSLEEKGEDADYRLIAVRLGLSESSIRDYIGKIVAKGIPIDKEKINNKKVILRISPDLKKIATLDTILKLIEL
ncbi:MAG: hypothetical protein AABW73_03925 [Nanoarchaeota archaeon]